MSEKVFGVDILDHLKKQLVEEELSKEQKEDLQGLIQHLESGKRYEDYRKTN